jgi:hypothetical protein
MGMQIVNTKILKDAKLSANDMAFYLRHHGWQERSGKNTRIRVFQGVNDDFGRPFLLMIPTSDQFRDAVLRLSEALELLAALDDCSIEEMLTKIQNFLQAETISPVPQTSSPT